MSSKRQQTMAKMERERTVKERRARKLEKKRERKLAAAEGAGEGVEATADETSPEPTASNVAGFILGTALTADETSRTRTAD